ncbi:MAG: hypothetical protein HY865_02630 [Chloroflexi bacterium]|nr:hypothetical protein [Chloroflexota bacterium]
MENRFYNSATRKKKGKWAYVIGTGDSKYDLGLYYLSRMIHELLTSHYYSSLNASRLVPEEVYEIKSENAELSFLDKVLSIFVSVTLSKLIEHKRDTWNFHQLLKETKSLNWVDYREIEQAVTEFEKKIGYIKNCRNELFAHTSKTNQPNALHFMPSYDEPIIDAMNTLDMFVENVIPYKLNELESNEVDLRVFITKRKD